MKILLLDIETAPHKTYTWGLWNQNIGTNMLIEPGYTLCWAAKWHDQKEVMYNSIFESSPKTMVKNIHKLLDEADMVVHYYGSKFDIPTLNREFVMHGMKPPAPFKQLDLCKLVKSKFKFASSKLDYVCQQLGLGKKAPSSFDLWEDCMAKKPEAWAKMKTYNVQDVYLLEKLYNFLLPWAKGHANLSLFDGKVCPNCGSGAIQKRGFSSTTTLVYQRYQCKACGNWFRGGKSVAPKPENKFVNI